ncbi:MAG TPA: T9SS type A sorting domain-containing protein, partial [Chitinophagaceae bacterium]|nr:T9SS type A sorting domain-containing protein [Chitinophagaceae bacterium]
IALACIPLRFINTISGDTIMCERWTDTAGTYACNIPFGTYELTPLIGDFTSGDTLTPTCPASGTSTITVSSGGVISDFAFECAKTDYFDAFINASANGFVPGDTSLLTIWSGDWFKGFRNSCFARSTTITLTLDPDLSYVSSYDGTAPTSVSGSVITWALTGANLNNFRSRIKVATATSVKLGDTLCSVAHVDTAVGFPDPDLSNNTHHYCRLAGVSSDPNMKEVNPAGKGSAGFIAANVPMTYTIHFQNTGTAPARGITVIDTLPATLDAASFHLLSSTHNCLLYKDGPVLRFRFNDIYLPDSGTDYYGSMGSVTYAIRQAPGLVPGDEIKNRAAIYFDYNEAIITNYTLNTIEFPTRIAAGDAVKARIFPNPAHTEINIECGTDCSASITDMLGRIVVPRQSSPARQLTIPVINIPAGLYLLQISDDKGNRQNSKIVVRH